MGSIPILPAINLLKKLSIMRLKLIAVLAAVVAVFMFMCSFKTSNKVPNNYENFDVEMVGIQRGFKLYKITVGDYYYEVLVNEQGNMITL